MGIFTKASGLTIGLTATASTNMLMEHSMRESGKMTSKMVKVWRPGLMALDMRVTTPMVGSMASELICGTMAPSTRVTGKKIRYQA